MRQGAPRAHPFSPPCCREREEAAAAVSPPRSRVMKTSTTGYCLHPACGNQRPRSPLTPSTLRFRTQSPPGPGSSQQPSRMGNPWGTCFPQQH